MGLAKVLLGRKDGHKGSVDSASRIDSVGLARRRIAIAKAHEIVLSDEDDEDDGQNAQVDGKLAGPVQFRPRRSEAGAGTDATSPVDAAASAAASAAAAAAAAAAGRGLAPGQEDDDEDDPLPDSPLAHRNLNDSIRIARMRLQQQHHCASAEASAAAPSHLRPSGARSRASWSSGGGGTPRAEGGGTATPGEGAAEGEEPPARAHHVHFRMRRASDGDALGRRKSGEHARGSALKRLLKRISALPELLQPSGSVAAVRRAKSQSSPLGSPRLSATASRTPQSASTENTRHKRQSAPGELLEGSTSAPLQADWTTSPPRLHSSSLTAAKEPKSRTGNWLSRISQGLTGSSSKPPLAPQGSATAAAAAASPQPGLPSAASAAAATGAAGGGAVSARPSVDLVPSILFGRSRSPPHAAPSAPPSAGPTSPPAAVHSTPSRAALSASPPPARPAAAVGEKTGLGEEHPFAAGPAGGGGAASEAGGAAWVAAGVAAGAGTGAEPAVAPVDRE